MTKPKRPDDFGLDEILWGANEIADAAGLDRRAIYYVLQKNLLPAAKIGRKWTSTRRALIARCTGADGYRPLPPKSAAPARVPKSRKRKLAERHRAEA